MRGRQELSSAGILRTVRWLIFVVVASVGLAACGSSQPHRRAAAFGGELVGGGCSSTASGSSTGQTRTTAMTCAIVFENGAQFRCRAAVKATTEARVAATRGCRKIASVRFPAARTVVMHQIAAVRDCLRRHGAHVIENVVTAGLPGASPDAVQSSNRRLVGELVSVGPAPAFIGFTVRAPFNRARVPAGWRVRTRGNVAVISRKPGLVTACAFTT